MCAGSGAQLLKCGLCWWLLSEVRGLGPNTPLRHWHRCGLVWWARWPMVLSQLHKGWGPEGLKGHCCSCAKAGAFPGLGVVGMLARSGCRSCTKAGVPQDLW